MDVQKRCLFPVIFMCGTSGVFALRVSVPTGELKRRHKTMWQGAGKLKHIITEKTHNITEPCTVPCYWNELSHFPSCSRGLCIVFSSSSSTCLNLWPLTFYFYNMGHLVSDAVVTDLFFSGRSREEHYLYLFNHLNYLYPYPKSEWAMFNPDVGGA